MNSKTKRPTTVINVRGLSPDEMQKRDDFVYAGRSISVRAGEFAGQIWHERGIGNPKRVDDGDDFRENFFNYFVYLKRQITTYALINDLIFELPGKQLGCWCCNWNNDSERLPRCHAAWLASFVDLLFGGDNEGVFVTRKGVFPAITSYELFDDDQRVSLRRLKR